MFNHYSGGWFLEPVKVGGESYNDADAKELATKEYVDSKVGVGGGGGGFMVHADATDGTGKVIIDKSFDEVAAAWKSGQNIVFRLKEPWGEHDYTKNTSMTNEDGSYSEMSFIDSAVIDYMGGDKPYLSFGFIKWAKAANKIEVHYAEVTSTNSGLDNEYNLSGTENPT